MFENLFWIGFIGAALALLFAVVQSRKVMKFSEGTDKMKTIAAAIRSGANAYLKRQYMGVLKIFIVVFIILLILAFGLITVLNINTGNVHISLSEIIDILLKKATDTKEYSIIWKIRLPSILMAAILGGALSLSGFLLQTFFENPIGFQKVHCGKCLLLPGKAVYKVRDQHSCKKSCKQQSQSWKKTFLFDTE